MLCKVRLWKSSVLSHRNPGSRLDETDTNYLHGNIIGDSEKAAGHRDQKKRTAGNSGSTSRTCSSQDAEDQSGREVYADTECMCSCQSMMEMVIAAPPMLMVAPRGMEME